MNKFGVKEYSVFWVPNDCGHPWRKISKTTRHDIRLVESKCNRLNEDVSAYGVYEVHEDAWKGSNTNYGLGKRLWGYRQRS